MTAILTIQNDDYSILLSDRRVTAGKIVRNDEYCKSGMIFCSDGRLAYGFTGLASYGTFRTSTWIVNTLAKAGAPGCSHQDLIQNFTQTLNSEFYKIPQLSTCPLNDRRLTIVFAGHFFDHHDIYGRLVVTSNFEDYNPVPGKHRPVGEFREHVATQDPQQTYYNISGFGNWSALNKNHTDEIANLVIARKRREAVVGKSIEILRKIADGPKAKNNIGKQIDEIYIPHDPRLEAAGKYHTAITTNDIWTPSLISFCGETITVVPELILSKVLTEEDSVYAAVPKVRMNSPCPCGNGRRYKNCHGGS